MKPRTQFEKLVKISNTKLADIVPNAIDWAVRTHIDHIAFRSSGSKCTCGDCAHRFHYKGNTEFHDRIVSLVNDNAFLFEKAKESA